MENLFKLNNNENIAKFENKYEQIILQPYNYLNDGNKGKELRNALIQVYNYLMKLDQVETEFVLKYIISLHTITLMIDDMQDSSEVRRKNPAVHIIYGVGRTISAVDFAFHTAISKMLNESIEVGMLTLNNIKNLLEGQTMEIYWRDNFICPSEEEYFDMVSKKTGGMFLAISTCMEFYSKTNVNLSKLSFILGIYYQVADDYMGLISKAYSETKGFCDDIREGKFIFPIIHAIKSRPNDTRILDILKIHTNDADLKMNCLELLEEFGSMKYTKYKINLMKNLIDKEVEKLGFKENFQKILNIQTQHKS